MAKFKALICVINGEVVKWTIFDSSWWVSQEKGQDLCFSGMLRKLNGNPLLTFWEAWNRKRLMNWLMTIDGSVKGKLLSSLAFHRNMLVTLLMFFNIGRFVQDGSLACW
jgi:hypothetical protein